MGRARAPGGGRRPTPTRLKKLNGNPGRRPLNEREPLLPAGMPACPPVLQGEAKAEWDRMSVQLLEHGLLASIDRAALTAYCLAWARLVDAEEKLRAHGVVVLSPNGFPMQSPYLAIANKALEQMTRMLVEFGMTPSSRARVKTEPGFVQTASYFDERGELDRGTIWTEIYGDGGTGEPDWSNPAHVQWAKESGWYPPGCHKPRRKRSVSKGRRRDAAGHEATTKPAPPTDSAAPPAPDSGGATS